MKLHYMGKYDMNLDELPKREPVPNAVPFDEAQDTKALSKITTVWSLILLVAFGVIAFFRCREFLHFTSLFSIYLAFLCSFLTLLPHELLHALCFKKDVYLYTHFRRGMCFIIGTESMSKARFIFLSLLPNILFGFLPYLVGMFIPKCVFITAFGLACISMGCGDYYNVYNALKQMPKGSRTYMSGFHSYWYMP